MIENIKPVESLTVADLEAHPVWEYLNDDEIGETMVQPVEKLPVESLDDRLVGSQVRLANGSRVWALIGNFNVTNPRDTQHFLTLSIEHGGKWFYLARWADNRHRRKRSSRRPRRGKRRSRCCRAFSGSLIR